MKRTALLIELLDDAVFSAHAASEGGHQSLDHVPGSALLGAAAARLYGALSAADAFVVFHSGRVRFGSGLPWQGDSIGYPVPQAWHVTKGGGQAKALEAASMARRLDPVHVYNFLHGSEIPGVANGAPLQVRPLREGYVHADGTLSRPRHGLRLKTAIDPLTGRAAEAQLFGYDALEKGQHFMAVIDADDDVGQALYERVIAALEESVLLGRSRSAEFGRARITRAPLPLAPVPSATGDHLVLWLLSDLAPCDRARQPTHDLDPEALGFPTGTRVLRERCFLRTRRYSPWNAARHGYDRERLVFRAGGVISLDLPPQTDRAALTDRLARGLGLNVEAGLGQVAMDAVLLRDAHPSFAANAAPSASAAISPRPDHPLLAWLSEGREDWKSAAETWAADTARQYATLLGRARRAAGVEPHMAFGPSKSQWGRVFEAARNTSGAALHEALFGGDKAVIKPRGEGWDAEVPIAGGQWVTLCDWLRQEIAWPATGVSDRAYAYRIRQLAHRVRDGIGQRRI